MQLLCVARFVPDGDWSNPAGEAPASSGEYHDGQELIGQEPMGQSANSQIDIGQSAKGILGRMRLCRQDAAAIGFALGVKQQISTCFIELVCLAPAPVIPQIEDILRVGVDKATLLADDRHGGSDGVTNDVIAQAKIIGGYLKSANYDWILGGNQVVGNDNAPLSPAIAEVLGIDHLADILTVDQNAFDQQQVVGACQDGPFIHHYALAGPAVLGFDPRGPHVLPYVRMKDKKRNVSDKLQCLRMKDLGLDDGVGEVLTTLARQEKQQKRSGNPIVVGLDDDGIDQVYRFLKENSLI